MATIRTLEKVRQDVVIFGISRSELARTSGLNVATVAGALDGNTDPAASTVDRLSSAIDAIISERTARVFPACLPPTATIPQTEGAA